MRRRQALAKQPDQFSINTVTRGSDTQEPSYEEQYEQKFGKAPHHRMKPETIKERVLNG